MYRYVFRACIGWACMCACHAYIQCGHMFSHATWMHVQSCQKHGCAFGCAKWTCILWCQNEHNPQLCSCMFGHVKTQVIYNCMVTHLNMICDCMVAHSVISSYQMNVIHDCMVSHMEYSREFPTSFVYS